MLATLDAYFHQVVVFVAAHKVWAAPIVALLAFGESLAFLSLLIPAWGALVAIGAMIGPGQINFWPGWIAAATGAALGTGCRTGSASSSDRRSPMSGRCRAI